MCRKLSLLPDFTITESATSFHARATRGLQEQPTIEDWEGLLRDLLKEDGSSSNFVFLIDALDECEPHNDNERLLQFFCDLLKRYPNIQVLCSSRNHVPVQKYFDEEILDELDLISSSPADEIEGFICSEIRWREKKLGNRRAESVVFKSGEEEGDLLKKLKGSLIRNSKGMYVWVQIWLNILLPTIGFGNIIRRRDNALELLEALENSSSGKNEASDQLQAGYQRLWDTSLLKGFDEVRIRLFRLVFCSFRRLSLVELTNALRIPANGNAPYDEDLSEQDIKGLYSNFLIQDTRGYLEFAHASAHQFLSSMKFEDFRGNEVDFSQRQNHESVSKLFIGAVRQPDYIFDRKLNLSLSQWSDICRIFDIRPRGLPISKIHQQITQSLKCLSVPPARAKGPTRPPYIIEFGLRHCRHAAEKQRIHDKVWSEVLDQVILPDDSAFAFLCIWTLSDLLSLWRGGKLRADDIFGESKGHLTMIYFQVLMKLDIIENGDFSEAQLKSLVKTPLHAESLNSGLRLFLEQATMKSLSGKTALHIACEMCDNISANIILQGSLYLHGMSTSLDLLCTKATEFGETPFTIAVECKDFTMMEILLKFEIECSSNISNNRSEQSVPNCRENLQWSHTIDMGGGETRSSLAESIASMDEDTLCRLLELAPPAFTDAGFQAEVSEKAFPEAAHRGFVKILRLLVGYGLNPNLQLALKAARDAKQEEAFSYLMSIDYRPE